jgi:hypothetical protein
MTGQGRTARGLLASRWIRHPGDYQGPLTFASATRRALPGNIPVRPARQAGSQAGSKMIVASRSIGGRCR